MQRRDFLSRSTTAGVAAILATNSVCRATASVADLPIIDTHQHLWDLKDFQPPWLGEADSKISAKHDMQDYVKETANLNVVKAVYMEVDVAEKDQNMEADFILKIIQAKNSPTVAAVISGRPGSAGFAEYMKRFRNEATIKGVRQVLHAGSAQRGLCLTEQFVKSVQLLGSMGKSFDLCMRPTELEDGAKLVSLCPDTRFIVDHCGNGDPHAWGRGDAKTKPSHTVEQWKRDMAKLASYPRVVCKISGIVARMPEGWQPDDLAPAINYCLDTFGPDRVMFAGDWPVCKMGATFAQWVGGLKQIVSSRPASEQKKLFHVNAAAFYGV